MREGRNESVVCRNDEQYMHIECYSLSRWVHFKRMMVPKGLGNMPTIIIFFIGQYVLPQLTCNLGSKGRGQSTLAATHNSTV